MNFNLLYYLCFFCYSKMFIFKDFFLNMFMWSLNGDIYVCLGIYGGIVLF